MVDKQKACGPKGVKPFLTEKTNKTSRTTLIEEERGISPDHLIAK